MIRGYYKSYIFEVIRVLTFPNYFRIKWLSPILNKNPLKLHLGSGNHYLPGWVNIEANPFKRKDCWLDLRNGLPFRDDSVKAIFSHSFFEHLDLEDLDFLLKECKRVLKMGGIMRIGVPSFEKGWEACQKGDWSAFSIHSRTISRTFINWILGYCQHKLMFTFESLKETLEDCGFSRIVECAFEDSPYLNEEDLKMTHKGSYKTLTLWVECLKKDS
ncbi:MAG: methyltransferase domain-containing protein [Candidatus Brocadiales bacterium]